MDLLLVGLGVLIASLLGAWLIVDALVKSAKKEIVKVQEEAEGEIQNQVAKLSVRIDETYEKIRQTKEATEQAKNNAETAWENSAKAVKTADKAETIAHNAVNSALKAEDSANEARKLVVELPGEITELKAGIAGLKNQIPSSVNYFNDINRRIDAVQVQVEAAKLERRDLEKTLVEHSKKTHQEIDVRFVSLQESDSNIIANLRRELGSEIQLAVGAADRANGLARNSLARLEKLEQQVTTLPATIGFQKLTQQLAEEEAEPKVEAATPEPEKKPELTDEQIADMTGADLAKYWGVSPYTAISRRDKIRDLVAAKTAVEEKTPAVDEPKPEIEKPLESALNSLA